MKTHTKRRAWVIQHMRGYRISPQAERALDGLDPRITDEEACIMIDLGWAFGLSDSEVLNIVGQDAYQRVTGVSGVEVLINAGIIGWPVVAEAV